MRNYRLVPCIKWSGSKRSQAEEIIKHFPEFIDTYYEPFVGGASVSLKIETEPFQIMPQDWLNKKEEETMQQKLMKKS